MGWGQIKKRCPRCKKLRRKVRDRRKDRQALSREHHTFRESRYSDTCMTCGGHEADGVHKLQAE